MKPPKESREKDGELPDIIIRHFKNQVVDNDQLYIGLASFLNISLDDTFNHSIFHTDAASEYDYAPTAFDRRNS